MGYTHSWRAKDDGEISPDAWAKIKADIEKLVAATDVPLMFEYDSNEPPFFGDDLIRFNGKLNDGHETFWLSRKLDDFQFCKTAFKKYDKIVVAALAIVAEHAPDKISVSSDGDEQDWSEGLLWGASILGRPLAFPVVEDEDD